MIRIKKGDADDATFPVVDSQIKLFGNAVGESLLGMSARQTQEQIAYNVVRLAAFDKPGKLPLDKLRVAFMEFTSIGCLLVPEQHALRVGVT